MKKIINTKNIIVEDSPPGIESGKASNNFVVAIDRGIFSEKELSNADVVVKEQAKKGAKNILAFSPAFVADCLETVIEIGDEYQEIFEEH